MRRSLSNTMLIKILFFKNNKRVGGHCLLYSNMIGLCILLFGSHHAQTGGFGFLSSGYIIGSRKLIFTPVLFTIDSNLPASCV